MKKEIKLKLPEGGIATIDNYSSKSELASNIVVSQNGSTDTLDIYDPSQHRPKETSTSSMGAFAHLLKASLGSGVLAMPLAFRNAGIMVGLIGTVLVGFICTHGLNILVRVSQEMCIEIRKPALGYAETCQQVFLLGPKATKKFATIARETADWALLATHMGACCVYVVVVSESFKQVSDAYGGPDLPLAAYCTMCLIPLIPLTQITRLKYLVPFSAIANLVWLVSICICLYYCLTDIPSLSERELSTTVASWPLFICTALFAMEGVGVVMPLENEMAKPQQFLGCPGVLNIAMSLVVCMYGIVGFLGYLKYGDYTRGSLTLNLPQEDVLAQCAKILVALVLMLSYALLYYVPVDVVWSRISHRISSNRHTLSIHVIRFIGVLITVGIATALPKLELLVELVGSVCLSILGLLMPALVETAWRWDRGLGAFRWMLWKNVVLAIFALMCLVLGSISAIKKMVDGS